MTYAAPTPVVQHRRIPRPQMTPKRSAVLKRVAKVGGYYVIGYVLAIASFAVVYLLTRQQVDQVLIQIVGFIVASVTGGIHKAINWKEIGINEGAIPTPPADASLPAMPTEAPSIDLNSS